MARRLVKSLYAMRESLLVALTDAARRERAVIGVLAGYTLVWTLYAVLAKSSQDVHFDMAELFGWSHELALGYAKHPPLAAAVVKLWFSVFPAADWAFALLSMTNAALALWLAWLLSGSYLDGEKRVVGLALLMLIPFFNFHALKFNANTILLPVWAATTWWFLRSFETRRPLYAALAGLGATAAMLGKYWSIYLLAGLGLAALLDSRRAAYFRSAAPWITIAVGAVTIAPHLAWLIEHDFIPLRYAVDYHGSHTAAQILGSMVSYLIGTVAYVAVPVALALIATQPGRAALADTLVPAEPERRLVAYAFWAPLLLPIPVAFATGIELNPLWTISAWSLLPVVLLASPLVALPRLAAIRMVGIAILFPLMSLLASPLVAIVIHKAGVSPAQAHSRLLAERIAQIWRETTDRPLRFVGGDLELAYTTAFYLPNHPASAIGSEAFVAQARYRAETARDGIAFVCATKNSGCVEDIEERAARGPSGRRVEIELVRHYAGMAGEPARYLIITVPPVQ